MKVALFTPVDRRSAIARVSALVQGALVEAGHEVVIVAVDDVRVPGELARASLADAVDWRDQTAVRDIVWAADLVVHQIGNHFGFHAGSVFWIPLIGGTIVLHDFFVGDLFLLWAEGNTDRADEIVRRLYGVTIGEFRTIAHSGRFAEQAWPSMTSTEWITESADAVIAHSDFGLGPVIAATDAPVKVLPLPYDLPPVGATDRATGQDARVATSESGPVPETFRLLTFGHIIANKRCDDVIAALSASPLLRERVDYRICGEISDAYRRRLQSFADAIGVRVTITGALTDAVLAAELSAADTIAVIRQPTLESGSASSIEALLSGTPLVVLGGGSMGALPDDIVFRVAPGDFQAELTRTLRSIVGGAHDLEARGEAGRRYAEATFRADSYAAELIALAPAAAEHRVLREMDASFDALRTGPAEVARRYADDTAVFRP